MSRIGIISDIHGDIDALKIIFKHLGIEGISELYFCGGVVGYGSQPTEVCHHLQQIGACVVLGNHDWAVFGRTDYCKAFNQTAIEEIEYTRRAFLTLYVTLF